MRRIILTCLLLQAAALSPGGPLQRVDVRGNVFYSRAEIGRILDRGTSRQDAVRELLGTYHAAGFLDAALQASWNADSTGAAIIIHEGRRHRAGAIVINGNSYIAARYLSALLLLKPGSYFDQSLLRQDLASISRTYAEAGFPHAAVSLTGLAVSGDTVDYSYQIDEGPRVVLSAISVNGNLATSASVVLRIAGLSAGLPFSRSRLELARSRLLRSGLFIQVDAPALYATGDSGREELRLAVREDKYNTFFGALGYNQDQQRAGWLAGTVELEMRNIAGTARRMALRWERLQQYSSSLRASYQEPWLLGTAMGAALEVSHRIQDSLYTQSTGQALVTLPLSDNLTIGTGAAVERTVPGPVPTIKRSLQYSSVWTLSGDHRSPLGRPAGWRYGLRLQYGRKRYYDPAAQLTVGRAEADLEWSVPVALRQSADAALHVRLLSSGEHPVPRPDQYSLGGAATLRGYFEQQFTASQLGWASLEYRLAPAPGFSYYPFCDIGYLRDRDRGPDRLRAGYGAGFRLQTRIGRFQLDYGLGQGDRPLNGKIHLILHSDF